MRLYINKEYKYKQLKSELIDSMSLGQRLMDFPEFSVTIIIICNLNCGISIKHKL